MMAQTQCDISPIIWEIDGYVREMGKELRPSIIPSAINAIIYMFYESVCKYYIVIHNI